MAEKTATSLTIESSSTPSIAQADVVSLKTLAQIQSWSMKSVRFLKAIWGAVLVYRYTREFLLFS